MKQTGGWLAVILTGSVLLSPTAVLLGPQGAMAQCCGDCNVDDEVTVDEIITSVNRALEGCEDDGICTQEDRLKLLATGETTSYGPGSDGDVQAGAGLAYRDNGDGTVTDLNTGLMWEKKDDADGVHDKDHAYTWGMTEPPYTMNGTMVTEFLATLNAPPCFAGHCDWRIPNRRELESIIDASRQDPAIAPVFRLSCDTGCTVTKCSCTAADHYWSSTTSAFSPDGAWVGFFYDGGVGTFGKSDSYHVRAVRGGV